MKKIFNLYLFFTIFLVFCTGCNNHKKQEAINPNVFIQEDGTVVIREKNLPSAEVTPEEEKKTEVEFEVGEINFGPEEIRFGNE